jgi:iron complex transport system substrate-binding protein
MTRLWNTLGLITALLVAMLGGVGEWRGSRRPDPRDAEPAARETTLPNGARALRDASRHWVELKDFRRIASASTSADSVLLDLAEPDRIVAFTDWSARRGWHAYRYAGKARIVSLAEIEAIIALKPDLVLANVQGTEHYVARLEEAGIPVYDLGEMRGVDSFVASVRNLATLLGKPELAQSYIETFVGRLERVAGGPQEEPRKSAAYVAVFGQKLFGSGKNTSFADVLHYAGLVDKGAERYDDFPEYGAEQLLALDPELLVTHDGMGNTLCAYPGLDRLRACSDREHHILELPETVIGSTGAEMLIAAEELHAAAYPRPPSPAVINRSRDRIKIYPSNGVAGP